MNLRPRGVCIVTDIKDEEYGSYRPCRVEPGLGTCFSEYQDQTQNQDQLKDQGLPNGMILKTRT